MIEIDGARGGGQVVRTAAGLAAVTGRPVRVEAVRGDRPTPGLKPQHVAAVEAVAAACDADLEGAEEDSEALIVRPGRVRGGEFAVDVGTAGSLPLVFDAVLPLAVALPDSLELTATGGTDVAWSPPVEYLRRVKLPLLAGYGFRGSVTVERAGFYPAGGGRATLRLAPSTLAAPDVTDRGSLEAVGIYSTASESLADAEVADRQADAARAELTALPGSVPAVVERAAHVPADSPGSSLVLAAEFERSRAGFTALGERGKPAEEVAADAVADFAAFRAGTAAVDDRLADQLLPVLALAGGRLTVPAVTDHVESQRAVLEAFGADLRIEGGGDRIAVEATRTVPVRTSSRSG